MKFGVIGLRMQPRPCSRAKVAPALPLHDVKNKLPVAANIGYYEIVRVGIVDNIDLRHAASSNCRFLLFTNNAKRLGRNCGSIETMAFSRARFLGKTIGSTNALAPLMPTVDSSTKKKVLSADGQEFGRAAARSF